MKKKEGWDYLPRKDRGRCDRGYERDRWCERGLRRRRWRWGRAETEEGFSFSQSTEGKTLDAAYIWISTTERYLPFVSTKKSDERSANRDGLSFFFSFRVCLNETLNVAFVETAHDKICLGTCSVGVNKSPING